MTTPDAQATITSNGPPSSRTVGAGSPGARRPGTSPTGGRQSSPIPGVEAPTGNAGNPCRITSASTVTEAFGGQVVILSAGSSGTGSSLCRFVLARTRVGSGVTLEMSLTRDESRSVFGRVKSQVGNRSVAGVGDDAYYRSSTHALQLYVRGVVIGLTATTPRTLTKSQSRTLRAAQVALGIVIATEQ